MVGFGTRAIRTADVPKFLHMKILILTLLLALPVAAQRVETDQSILDAANVAFKEVVALRTAVTSLEKANTANALAAEAFKQVNDLLRADNADLRKLKCDSGSFFFVLRWKKCR